LVGYTDKVDLARDNIIGRSNLARRNCGNYITSCKIMSID